jgi:hypothetical protein
VRVLDRCGRHRAATTKGASHQCFTQEGKGALLSGLVFAATAGAGVGAVDAEHPAGTASGSELTDPGGFLYAATNATVHFAEIFEVDHPVRREAGSHPQSEHARFRVDPGQAYWRRFDRARTRTLAKPPGAAAASSTAW